MPLLDDLISQQAEQIDRLEQKLGMWMKIADKSQSENQRLKEALHDILVYRKVYGHTPIGDYKSVENIAEQALAAQPQKESE